MSASANDSQIYVDSIFLGVKKPSPWPKEFPRSPPLQGEIPPVSVSHPIWHQGDSRGSYSA